MKKIIWYVIENESDWDKPLSELKESTDTYEEVDFESLQEEGTLLTLN
jgi:hypothetical protein